MPGRRAHLLLLPLLAAGLRSCVDLPTIEENRCGNGFVETEEYCEVVELTARNVDTSGALATCNAPGTPNQCRWQCETTPQCQSAPVSHADLESGLASGWRCGVDHICRRPDGDDLGEGEFFRSLTSLVPGRAEELFTGDFDADGRADVLAVGAAGFDIHYFTRDGVLAKTLSVPTAPVIPAIGKLTSSAADDFTLDVGHGLGVMLGQLGQTVEPTSYLSLDIQKKITDRPLDDMLVLTLDVDDQSGPRPFVLLRTDKDWQILDTLVTLQDGPTKGLRATLSGLGEAAQIGRVPVASLGAGSIHESFALALRGAMNVHLFEGLPGGKMARSTVALPPGVEVHGAAFFVDVDADGLNDLVVGGAGGDTTDCRAEIDVAYGDGTGRFYAAPSWMGSFDVAKIDRASKYLDVYSGSVPVNPHDSKDITPVELYLPLEVGRLNADALFDYVTAYGIYVSDTSGAPGLCGPAPSGYCRAEGPSSGEVWTEARIADFNGTMGLDVAAVASGRPGIDLFSGTGTGISTPSPSPPRGRRGTSLSGTSTAISSVISPSTAWWAGSTSTPTSTSTRFSSPSADRAAAPSSPGAWVSCRTCTRSPPATSGRSVTTRPLI